MNTIRIFIFALILTPISQVHADFLSDLKSVKQNQLRVVFDEPNRAYFESKRQVYHIDCTQAAACVVDEGVKDYVRRLQTEWRTFLVADLEFEPGSFQQLTSRLEVAAREHQPLDLQDILNSVHDQKKEIVSRRPELEEVAQRMAITFGTMAGFFLIIGAIADATTAMIVGPQWFQISKAWTSSTNMTGMVAALGYLGIKVRGWKPIKFTTALKASTIHTFGGWSLQCAAFLVGLVP